jgi:hypothetical protein
MIDKRIAKSDKFTALSMDRSRVLYFMIYPHLDCEGRHSADPRDIKEDCCPRLPYTLSQVTDSLIDLHNVGLIRLYEVDNKAYLEADRFEDFQPGLRKDREAPSEIPAYSGVAPTNSGGLRSWSALSLRLKLSLSSSINPPISPQAPPSKKPHYKIQLILDDGPKRWEGITDDDKVLWAKTYPKFDIEQVLAEIIAYWDARPRTELKQNWKKTIVNRLSWLKEHGGNGGGRGTQTDRRAPDPPQIGANIKADKTPAYWAEVRRLKAEGIEGQALTDALEKKAKEGKP